MKLDLDKALRTWDEDEEEKKDFSESILAKIKDAAPSAVNADDEALFAAPLPAGDDEGVRKPKRERDRGGLRELAKLASDMKPVAGSEKKEDSGIVHLSLAAKADPEAEVRAKSAPLAVEPLLKPVSIAPATPVAVAAPAEPSQGRGRVYIMSFVALAAAAAGVFFLRTTPVQPAPPAPMAAAATTTAAPPVETATPTKATPQGIDPNALPTAVGKVAAGGTPSATKKEPGAPVQAAPIENAPHQPTPAAPGDLNAAMKKEVGEKTPTPAALLSSAGQDLPQKPSSGAVNGAIGTVLPDAKACLGPDDPVSRATIVFASNGTVSAVSVTGAAAGTPAAECITAALRKAKVQPFAEASYSANITIRH